MEFSKFCDEDAGDGGSGGSGGSRDRLGNRDRRARRVGASVAEAAPMVLVGDGPLRRTLTMVGGGLAFLAVAVTFLGIVNGGLMCYEQCLSGVLEMKAVFPCGSARQKNACSGTFQFACMEEL